MRSSSSDPWFVFIVALALACLILDAIGLGRAAPVIGLVILVVLALSIGLRGHLPVAEACASCGSRTGYVYTHTCVDGTPDLRFRSNPLRCRACWSERRLPPSA